jgi:hypothetical protein
VRVASAYRPRRGAATAVAAAAPDVRMYALMAAATFLLLADMIYKPGA